MKKSILEIACFNVASAMIAAEAGASRIELCENYSIGGITPSQEQIINVKESVGIPVFVMIRPRGGDFLYAEQEFEKMKQQIEWCKEHKIDGVVFGMLTPQKKVDEQRCRILVQMAQPMSCTFHRAFDETENVFKAIDTIIRCGFQRILTSGQEATAIVGAQNILRLMEYANNNIIILPGGGIRPDNILELKTITGGKEFHSAALEKNQLVADKIIIQQLLQELTNSLNP